VGSLLKGELLMIAGFRLTWPFHNRRPVQIGKGSAHFASRGAMSLALTPASDLALLISALQLLSLSVPKSSSGIKAPTPAVATPNTTARPPRKVGLVISGRRTGVMNDPVTAMGPRRDARLNPLDCETSRR